MNLNRLELEVGLEPNLRLELKASRVYLQPLVFGIGFVGNFPFLQKIVSATFQPSKK